MRKVIFGTIAFVLSNTVYADFVEFSLSELEVIKEEITEEIQEFEISKGFAKCAIIDNHMACSMYDSKGLLILSHRLRFLDTVINTITDFMIGGDLDKLGARNEYKTNKIQYFNISKSNEDFIVAISLKNWSWKGFGYLFNFVESSPFVIP